MSAPARHPAAEKRILRQRDPQILLGVEDRNAKVRRHDYNHREWTLVEHDRTSDDFWIGCERAAPQVFADDYNGRSAFLAVVGEKNPSRERLHVEKRKIFGSDDRSVDYRRRAAARERKLVSLNARHFSESMILRAPFFVIGVRNASLRDSLL